MNIQTADILTDLEFADDQFLKKLYNYTLATQRHDYENMLDAREEFLAYRNNPEAAKMWYKISKNNSIANRKKKEKDSTVRAQ